jgi:hypothetical protein
VYVPRDGLEYNVSIVSVSSDGSDDAFTGSCFSVGRVRCSEPQLPKQ